MELPYRKSRAAAPFPVPVVGLGRGARFLDSEPAIPGHGPGKRTLAVVEVFGIPAVAADPRGSLAEPRPYSYAGPLPPGLLAARVGGRALVAGYHGLEEVPWRELYPAVRAVSWGLVAVRPCAAARILASARPAGRPRKPSPGDPGEADAVGYAFGRGSLVYDGLEPRDLEEAIAHVDGARPIIFEASGLRILNAHPVLACHARWGRPLDNRDYDNHP